MTENATHLVRNLTRFARLDCVSSRPDLVRLFGSLFLRDCKRCRVVAACGQFRTRDCQQVDTYLHCSTQPIIEASTQMRFACYQLYYPQLKGRAR